LFKGKHEYLEFPADSSISVKTMHIKGYINALFGKNCWEEKGSNQFSVNGKTFKLWVGRVRRNYYNTNKVKFNIGLVGGTWRTDRIFKKVQSNNYERIVISGVEEAVKNCATAQKEIDRKESIEKRKKELEGIAQAGDMARIFGGRQLKKEKDSYQPEFTTKISSWECRITPKNTNNKFFSLEFKKEGDYYSSTRFNDLNLATAISTIKFFEETMVPFKESPEA